MPLEAPRTPVLLLLTATVDVGSTPYVSVSDPRVRLAEYTRGLRWYAGSRGHDGIVFCESSSHPLDPLRHAAGDARVEFLQPRDDLDGAPRGKGYGELSIVRHALEASNFVRLAGPDAIIVKITGRYVIRNIAALVASLRAGRPPDVVADLSKGLTRADTRICAFRAEFARRYLLPQQELVNDAKCYFVEQAFARAVHLGIADGARWQPWRVAPDIDGTSGSAGRAYRRDPVRRLARAMMRRLLWLTLAR